MTRRTSQDWKHLIDEQIASGLTIPQFCFQHSLSSKYFYARKAILAKQNNNSHFIQAKITPQQTSLLATNTEQSIKLITPSGELQFPSNTSATFLIELLSGLAS